MAPGKDPGDRAQDRYELSDEDDLAAMPQEQILTELDPAFGDPQIPAIVQQQPIAESTTDNIADHATDDRRARRRQNYRGDVEIVLGSSNDRSDDERRLSRERNADVFQADETSDDKQAVDVNEVRDGWHGDRGLERRSLYSFAEKKNLKALSADRICVSTVAAQFAFANRS